MHRELEQYIPVTESGCWLFEGKSFLRGYGRFSHNGLTILAHRASYERHNGAIPKGMHVLHKCDVPSCINPNHLFIGTNYDNVQDRVRKGRTKTGIGGRNSHAKLSREDVLTIRSSRARNRWLASKYCVDENTICAIKKGKTWKSVAVTELNHPRSKNEVDSNPTWEIRENYTHDDDEYILQNYRKLGSFACAEATGKTFRSVRNRAMRLGISRTYKKRSCLSTSTSRTDAERDQ